MGREDRLSDNVRYVINGIVRKPLIWILLSIFCIGDYLINTGTVVLISMDLITQYVRVNVDIPVYLLQYGVVIPALMILAGFLLILFKGGYVTTVYRGVFPAPPVNNWKRLLFDGFRLWLIDSLYLLIPVLILICTVGIPLFQLKPVVCSSTLRSLVDTPGFLHFIEVALGGILLSGILFICLKLLSILGKIRFSRTGRFLAAFEVSSITKKISEIGWIRYILSLILLFIILLIIVVIMAIISGIIIFIGHLNPGMRIGMGILRDGIFIFTSSAILVFIARYLSLLFDQEREIVQEKTINGGIHE